MVLKTSLACGLQECIGNLWKNDESGDFTVVVESTPFLCHRLILSTCSSFFQELFRSEMKETHENRTIISGMTKDTLEVILTSVYMGTDGLTTDNILDIWPATVQLQIKYLIKECEDFIMQNISVDNCFSILYHAHLLSCKQVVDYSLDFMAKHFEQICNTEGLVQLSFDDFHKIVTSDRLTSSSEDLVVKTVLKWVEYTDNQFYKDEVSASSLDNHNMDICDNQRMERVMAAPGIRNEKVCSQNSRKIDKIERTDRKQNLYTLISGCKIHLLDVNFHQQLLKNHKLMSCCEKTSNFLLDSLMHKMSLGSQHVPRSDTVLSTASAALKHVIVFGTRECIMTYDLDNGFINEYLKFPADLNSAGPYNITVGDNMLYVLYNNREGNCILSMYSGKEQWKQLNCSNSDSALGNLIYHDTHVYRYSKPTYKNNVTKTKTYKTYTRCFLEYCHHMPDNTTEWITLTELHSTNIIFTVFKHYILSCYTVNKSICVEYYNPQTKYLTPRYTMNNGFYEAYHGLPYSDVKLESDIVPNAVSFTHQGDVFIVLSCGSLLKVTSADMKPVVLQDSSDEEPEGLQDISDIVPVGLQFISQLWNLPMNLYGAVIYKEQLFVFYKQTENRAYKYQVSLPGIFESFKMIEIDSKTDCWPMILH